MDAWVRAAMDVAAKQDGLISWHELRASGATEKNIAGAVARGWLAHDQRGVYAVCGSPSTWRRRIHAAVLSAGGLAAVSHSCAATLWEFKHLPYFSLEIVVTAERHIDMAGISVHTMTLDPLDVDGRFGVPVTTFERTLVDCTTVLSRYQLSANLDDGLRRNIASLARLRDCYERLASGPGRRLSVIRDLLDERPSAYDPGGSRAERRVLDVLVAAGLPAPVQQHRVVVDGKAFYLDYAYPERNVFIEYYGTAWHGTPSAAVYDSARISALSTASWQPLIFTEQTPDHVMVDQVRKVLAPYPKF